MPVRIQDIPSLNFTSLNQPMMDTDAAEAPGRALVGLAKEVAEVSEPFAKIANRLQDAQNAKLEGEIEDIYEAKKETIRQRYAGDPTNPAYLQELKKLGGEITARLEKGDVSPESRERMTPRLQRGLGLERIHAAQEASTAVIQQGKATFQKRMSTAVGKDAAEIDREADHALEQGVVSPAEVEAERARAKATQEDQVVYQEIQKAPMDWMRRNANPDRSAPGFDNVKHANRMREARRVYSGVTLGTYYTLAQRIEEGTLTKKQEIEAMTVGLPAAATEKLNGMLKEREQGAQSEKRPAHEVQAELAGEVGSRLLAYKADGNDYDSGLVEIADRIRRMDDGPLKTAYEEDLQSVITGKKRVPKTNAEYYRMGIDNAWENYQFGRKKPLVHHIDVTPLITQGLLQDRAKLKLAGLGEADIDYITGRTAHQNRAGSAPQPPVDAKTALARFAERYGAIQEKPRMADPFLNAVFTTLGTGKTKMEYTTPEDATKTERENAKARASYGAALTNYSAWVQRNPDADEEKLRAAAEREMKAIHRHNASSAVLGL